MDNTTQDSTLAKNYNPKDFEARIYKYWLDNGYFTAQIDAQKQPFTIIMPPPNITGQLHIGHAFEHTMQDAVIRYKRMQGFSALWLPGTDHASIATEAKIVEDLAKSNLTKQQIGREKYLERAWEWNNTYGGRIVEQIKVFGASCDFSRQAFTMDEQRTQSVKIAFKHLYDKGLIYKGERITNYCTTCKTAISDAEVNYEESDGNLWQISYPLTDGNGSVVVATTRPETMLGDVAIAVNPDDKRYSGMIGKTANLPLTDRTIPIIADNYVEKEFGTGAVKITPCHDPNDFEVGMRHSLTGIKILNDDGTVNENGGKYQGLTVDAARKKVLEDLQALGLLKNVKPHKHNVGHCSRCSQAIQPMTSSQWFVSMKQLAEPALEVVNNGQVKFVPARFKKIYNNWLVNIKDWCISRQLWWGHRIPVYYCADCGHMYCDINNPDKCQKCGSNNITQDESVLDTWFSSALWPFSTLGWPQKTADLDYFYPNDLMITGSDLIFFWVARMIFSALEYTGKPPFKTVLIHGMVRDEFGRKMSKSAGNGVDPLEVIEQYGSDTMRLALIGGVANGADTRLSNDKLENSRNFINKIWNSARFIKLNLGNFADFKLKPLDECQKTPADNWMLAKLNKLVAAVTKLMDKYELGLAASVLYEFVWNTFCDWYLELIKPTLYNADGQAQDTFCVLNHIFLTILKLMHPLIPFVTEELYSNLCGEPIIISEYPKIEKAATGAAAAKMDRIIEFIKQVRVLRHEYNVTPSKKLSLYLTAKKTKSVQILLPYIKRLCGFNDIYFAGEKQLDKRMVSLVGELGDAFIPITDLIDIDAEIVRLNKEIQVCDREIDLANSKLNNTGFASKAPPALIEAEKQKLVKYTELKQKYQASLDNLKQ